MPRSRRDWTAMRAELRRLLRETTSATSFWLDTELLDFFNQAMDLRVMMLADAHEGWVTDSWDIDVVADQAEYAIPEGTGRIKRVLWVTTEGSTVRTTPLTRNERFSDSSIDVVGSSASLAGTLPDYRLVGEYLVLSPAPTEAVTNGLKIELESAPARISADGDKLDLRFPDVMETLLIYDTWDIALGVEDAQGNINDSVRGRLQNFHRKYEAAFMEFTAVRSFGRTFSTPFYLGD